MKAMPTHRTLLLIAAVLALALAPGRVLAADLSPMVVQNLGGNLHIFQSTPFGCSDLAGDVSVIGGRFEIVPSEGLDVGSGQKLFVLTRGHVKISPFTATVSCITGDETRTYSALHVEVASQASFVGVPVGGGVYNFSIAPGAVLLRQVSTANGAPEIGYKHPRDPVVGTIDLTSGALSMTVVVATRIHVGILGDFDGELITTLNGTIAFPDADGDSVPDRSDNCMLVPNPSQAPVSSPLLRAPDDVTLHSCLETRIGRPVAADLCEDMPLAVTHNAPHPYPLGTTVVTWRAKDSDNRVTTATQTVTIDDTTPPEFTSMPPDVLMFDCGPADLGLPTAEDDCGGSPVLTNDAPAKFLVGTTVVTWTATDLSGNRATATQLVTVIDTVPPEVFCTPGTNPAGNGNGHGGFFEAFATDHCEVVTQRLGSYVLTVPETIKISETGEPGVSLINVMGPDDIRHFRVHRGEAVIVATDGSDNTASTVCRR